MEGYEIEPENGKDIVTTIDVNTQDIAENALLNMMEENECEQHRGHFVGVFLALREFKDHRHFVNAVRLGEDIDLDLLGCEVKRDVLEVVHPAAMLFRLGLELPRSELDVVSGFDQLDDVIDEFAPSRRWFGRRRCFLGVGRRLGLLDSRQDVQCGTALCIDKAVVDIKLAGFDNGQTERLSRRMRLGRADVNIIILEEALGRSIVEIGIQVLLVPFFLERLSHANVIVAASNCQDEARAGQDSENPFHQSPRSRVGLGSLSTRYL